MNDQYEPSGSTKAKLAWMTEQLEAAREHDPARYEAMAEGMHLALAAVRAACDALDHVLASLQDMTGPDEVDRSKTSQP